MRNDHLRGIKSATRSLDVNDLKNDAVRVVREDVVDLDLRRGPR